MGSVFCRHSAVAGSVFSEIISQADFQTYGRIVAEIVHAHLIVNRRLHGEVVVKIESVADFHRHHKVVIALGVMHKLCPRAHENSVLGKIVASVKTGGNIIGVACVPISEICINKQSVAYENAGRAVKIEPQAFVGTVLYAQT